MGFLFFATNTGIPEAGVAITGSGYRKFLFFAE